MKNNLLLGIVVLIIVALLVSLADPFMLLMPASFVMMALVVASVLVCVFAGFVLREKAGDEREALHRLTAGRIAYLAGLAVLALGVLCEGIRAHHVDPWLLIALGVMIVAKLATRLYADTYK
jgi:hypothetical protein